MAPAHMSPLVAERVVLEKKVVLAAEEHQSVGIVGPMLTRRKVDLRTVGLVVSGRLSQGSRYEDECPQGQTSEQSRFEELGHSRVEPEV